MEIFEWNLRSGSGDRCLSGGGSGPQDLIDGNLSGGIGFKNEMGKDFCHRCPPKVFEKQGNSNQEHNSCMLAPATNLGSNLGGLEKLKRTAMPHMVDKRIARWTLGYPGGQARHPACGRGTGMFTSACKCSQGRTRTCSRGRRRHVKARLK